MKERKGYKRRLIEKTVCSWTYKVFRTWEYTWSDGSVTTKTTVRAQ